MYVELFNDITLISTFVGMLIIITAVVVVVIVILTYKTLPSIGYRQALVFRHTI